MRHLLRCTRYPWKISNCDASKLAGSTDAVVCGGGLAGASVAYHLAKRGKKVTLIEKYAVGVSGATALCSGLVTAPVFWRHPTCQYLAHRSLKLYEELADHKGFDFTKCGRVYVSTGERTELVIRRMLSRGRRLGGVQEMVNLKDLPSLAAVMNTTDVRTAMFSTEDVRLDTVALVQEMAEEAAIHGAHIVEGVRVKEVLLGDERQVYAVETTQGLIETPIFVDAAGVLAGQVTVKSLPHGSVQLSMHPAYYQNLLVNRVPSYTVVSNDVPIVNDMDGNIMVHTGSRNTILAGFREEDMRAAARKETGRWAEKDPDWDRFEQPLARALTRFPILAEVEVGDLISGLEAYTPDGLCMLGESSQAKGYYVTGGFCGQGLSLAGGAGEVLAEWICDSVLSIDPSPIDIGRFLELHANSQYMLERTPEVASLTYRNVPVLYQFHSARNLRTSPVCQHMREAGAVFGEIMGYERPLWFERPRPEKSLYNGGEAGEGKPEWFPFVAEEYQACRERVGLIDMSPFSKFEIRGENSVRLLQYLCSADIDKPIGTTIYTGMQNERGGYVTDCTLSRLGEFSWFMVAPTIQQERVPVWMSKWAKEIKAPVIIQDVTASYTALNVVGPLSRHLMSDLTDFPVNPSAFPAFRCNELQIGMANGIRAISVSHCGELGWVLYIPNEQAQNVYERIVEAGKRYSLMHAGYYALRHLRIEKLYVYWGQDIDTTVTPVECGRSFRVQLDKDFIGKKAIEMQILYGMNKRFVHILIDEHDMNKDPWPEGGENVLKDGSIVGRTTSSAYAFTLGCQVCIAVVHKEDGVTIPYLSSGNWEIEIAGRRFPVRISAHSPSIPMVSSEQPQHYHPTQ